MVWSGGEVTATWWLYWLPNEHDGNDDDELAANNFSRSNYSYDHGDRKWGNI